MTRKEYRDQVGKFRNKYQKGINDLFIWSEVAIISFDHALEDEEFLAAREYQVPSRTSKGSVTRNKKQVTQLIRGAKSTGLNHSIFAFLIAQGEAFLHDVLRCTLVYDNKRLKTAVNGFDHVKSIKVAEIVDRRSRSELIEVIVESELNTLFYARPAIQFRYLEEITGVSLEEDLKAEWAEYKASRDLIVHNAGKINKIYLGKAGNKSRGQEGDIITVDRDYTQAAMANIKSLIGKTCSQIQKDLK